MGAADLTLSPGDILRATVVRLDSALDACVVDGGAHGRLVVPLADTPGTTVAKLAPGTCVCVQVLVPARGNAPARATLSIEFSGRTSVLVLDGTAITGPVEAGATKVFASKKLPAVTRADLVSRLEEAFAEDATGLSSMHGVVNGPVTVVLRSTANEVAWDEVVGSVVVQMTEAAAFTVLARADATPALLMAEKPDADGDVSLGMATGVMYGGTTAQPLDGRCIELGDGGELVFERTEGMLCAAVRPAPAPADPQDTNRAAARAFGEAVCEFEPHGLVALTLLPGALDEPLADLREALGSAETCMYGVPELSVVMLRRP